MEHWLDRIARGVAEERLSRRQVVAGGVRALAAGAAAGGGLRLVGGLASAQGKSCAEIPEECRKLGAQAQDLAEAACATELPANQTLCMDQASLRGLATEVQCANKSGVNNCPKCQRCFQGECEPYCLFSCQYCNRVTGICADTCPSDQYCAGPLLSGEDGGGCVPKCPSPCAVYDPATGGCRDKCADENPCMACVHGICQSNCPDPGDFCDSDGKCKACDGKHCRHIDESGVCRGCDPNCQVCSETTGTCLEKCNNGEICCEGQCFMCCGGTCNQPTGTCNDGDTCAEGDTCCPPGRCADLQHDPQHCGSCGYPCPPAQPVCRAGQCTACQADYDCQVQKLGENCCSGACTDVRVDNQNCGSCGHACPPSQTCQSGKCVACFADSDCPSGLHCCSGACVNLQTDPNNCGACGKACPNGEQCNNGTCPTCPPGAPAGSTPCGTSVDPNGYAICCPPGYQCWGTGNCVDCCPDGQMGCSLSIGCGVVCYDPSQYFCCPTYGECPIGWECCDFGTVGGCCPGAGCCSSGP